MHKVLGLDTEIVEPVDGISGLLNDPFLIGMIRNGTAKHLAAAQMDEDEKIGVNSAGHRMDGFRKEIASEEALHVGLDERFPRNMASPFSFCGFGKDIFCFENVAYGRDTYTNSQLLEFSDNPAATPAKVLTGESAHQDAHRSGGVYRQGNWALWGALVKA